MQLRNKKKAVNHSGEDVEVDSSAEDDEVVEVDSSAEDNNEVASNSSQDDIEELEDLCSDSDSDAPEDISLKQSKLIAKERKQKEIESIQLVKNKKKEKLKEREGRNKVQQDVKRKTKSVSLVPEKLDQELLELVDSEVPNFYVNKIASIGELAEENEHKILFSDDEEDDIELQDEDEDEVPHNKIEARYIGNICKQGNDNNVQGFLRNHFYGDRIDRESFKVNICSKKRKNNSYKNFQKKLKK